MTSYEFEVAAKNAVIRMYEERYDTMLSIEDLSIVWFGWIIGNMKCLVYGPEMGRHYAEVTYVKDDMVMYVDLYVKDCHRALRGKDIDTVVHVPEWEKQ